MLRLTCDITIGQERFDYVNEVQIISAWKNLTDTAVIKLPRNLVTRDNMKIGEQVKVGQAVEIKLGYDLKTATRFKGYVDTIGAATEIVEIKCQDEMWNLKQGSISKSWETADIETVLSHIKTEVKGLTCKVSGDNLKLGPLTIEGLSPARILQKLKDDYSVYSFFRDGELIVGVPYAQTPQPGIVFEYGKNVISWKGLSYKDEADVKAKVKIINAKPDGTKEESLKGDSGGEERTLHYYNLSKADLDKHAETILKQMKYSGYRGKFTVFGEPQVNHGDVANIKDKRVDGREGDYYIDGVDTSFSSSGMRQAITLGPKAS